MSFDKTRYEVTIHYPETPRKPYLSIFEKELGKGSKAAYAYC